MVIKIIARVGLSLLKFKVRIQPLHLRAPAREMLAGIRGNRNWDTQPGLLGESLEFVVPTGDDWRAWDLPKIEMIHLLVGHLGHGCPCKPWCAWFLFNRTVLIDNRPMDEQHPS